MVGANMRFARYSLLVGLLWMCGFAPLASAESKLTHYQLLERMGQALSSLNYQGTFVYRSDDRMETLQIQHRRENGTEMERLVTLNGVPREVVRTAEAVTCIFPDQNAVYIDRHHQQGPLLSLPDSNRGIENYYRLRDGVAERIAGRDGRLLEVIPRDGFRYGYRFWLDSEYHFPLRTEVVASGGELIEQIMFTKLELDITVNPESLKPQHDLTKMRHFEGRGGLRTETMAELPWRLPANVRGFRLMKQEGLQVPGNPMTTHHLVYGDGFATVSVYLEPQPEVETQQSLVQVGAVNSLLLQHQDWLLTLMGEVPPKTLRHLGQAIIFAGRLDD